MQWPFDSVPEDFHVDGYSEDMGSASIETEMDAGLSFKRKRYTAVVPSYSGQIMLTSEQCDSLEQFWHDTEDGTIPFDWRHPRTKRPALVRFKGTDAPKPTARTGDYFIVPIRIEILP